MNAKEQDAFKSATGGKESEKVRFFWGRFKEWEKLLEMKLQKKSRGLNTEREFWAVKIQVTSFSHCPF